MGVSGASRRRRAVRPGAGELFKRASRTRVLNGTEESREVRGEFGATELTSHWTTEELAQRSPLAPIHRDHIDAIVLSEGAGLTIGGNPQIPLTVKGDVIRGRDRAHETWIGASEEGAVGGIVRVATEDEDLPGEGCGGGVVVALRKLDDLTMMASVPPALISGIVRSRPHGPAQSSRRSAGHS